MSTKEERLANLRRASAMTRQQDNLIQSQLYSMDDEELNNFVNNDESLKDMLTIGADEDNKVIINYANQPQNDVEEISYTAPWEGNLSSVPTTPQYYNNNIGGFMTNGNSCGGYYSTNPILYQNQYSYSNNDPRLTTYYKNPGMKFYNINPYAFYDEHQMMEHYEYLEEERRKQQNTQYFWYKLCAMGDSEMLEYAKQFKFKPADQIVAEAEEERKRKEEEYRKEMAEYVNDSEIEYDVYDENGYCFRRVCAFKVIDPKTGEVVFEKKYRKDEKGQSYIITNAAEESRMEYEAREIARSLYEQDRRLEMNRKIAIDIYTANLQRWDNWRSQGLTDEEMWVRWEDERIDWKRQTELIERMLKTSSYSKDRYDSILRECCHCDLDYANRSDFFSLSYDFERDLHYKKLISTPEEMQNDPRVHDKLKQEYEIKRNMFMNKVNSGDLRCDMQTDAHFRPTFPKPNIDTLTLEDFDKPENQTMYTKIVTPQLATPNMFIPESKSRPDMTIEDLRKLGANLDKNGQPIPQQRTFGIMSVDEDTGQVISQEEYDVTSITDKISNMNDMSNDELINIGF